MSDWFDNKKGETPGGETPPSSGIPGGTTGEGYSREEPPVPLSGAAGEGNPEPPAPSVQNSYQPPAGGYYSQGYDPYGWQQPPQGPASPQPQPPRPPKKKKSAAGILIALLAVVCAGTIITLSVLLAVALSDDKPPVSGSSSVPSDSVSGGATLPSRVPDENAPSLNIKEPAEDAEGLSTSKIYQNNKDSTVVLTMYMKQSTFTGDEEETLAGEASGIIMTADGYIITNRHCVINEKAGDVPYSRIEVTLYNGTVYESAEIIGTDSYSDLAVIRVNATDLQAAEFGDSSQVSPGDRVVAIGNAGGLRWTITQGILSGVGRDVYEASDYAIKCLQVDAAINPGNSGGPLFNGLGQVVGINSAKIADAAGEYENLGFAIPINEAKAVIDDLTKYGYVKGRVMLSITGLPFSRTGYDSGFQIASINSDSVFVGTQVRVGDIITYIDGVRVKNAAELTAELSKHKVGEEVEITLNRIDSRTRRETTFTVKVTLVESRGN